MGRNTLLYPVVLLGKFSRVVFGRSAGRYFSRSAFDLITFKTSRMVGRPHHPFSLRSFLVLTHFVFSSRRRDFFRAFHAHGNLGVSRLVVKYFAIIDDYRVHASLYSVLHISIFFLSFSCFVFFLHTHAVTRLFSRRCYRQVRYIESRVRITWRFYSALYFTTRPIAREEIMYVVVFGISFERVEYYVSLHSLVA